MNKDIGDKSPASRSSLNYLRAKSKAPGLPKSAR